MGAAVSQVERALRIATSRAAGEVSATRDVKGMCLYLGATRSKSAVACRVSTAKARCAESAQSAPSSTQQHPALKQTLEWGLLPSRQLARSLARCLRAYRRTTAGLRVHMTLAGRLLPLQESSCHQLLAAQQDYYCLPGRPFPTWGGLLQGCHMGHSCQRAPCRY
jgi:hypothetical protein